MTDERLRELVERMAYYEEHQHFDGYDTTLDEFHRELQSRPVSMAMAILEHWERSKSEVAPG